MRPFYLAGLLAVLISGLLTLRCFFSVTIILLRFGSSVLQNNFIADISTKYRNYILLLLMIVESVKSGMNIVLYTRNIGTILLSWSLNIRVLHYKNGSYFLGWLSVTG